MAEVADGVVDATELAVVEHVDVAAGMDEHGHCAAEGVEVDDAAGCHACLKAQGGFGVGHVLLRSGVDMSHLAVVRGL